MPDWLIPAICGLIVAAVLLKAFWKPPECDPNKEPWNNPDIMP